MAKRSARVVLNGRFSPGTVVDLVEARDEAQLRPAPTDRVVDSKKVDKDGRVEFTSGVEADGRYFLRAPGYPDAIRARGRADGDDDSTLGVAPVGNDRVRLSDGSWLDEAPEQHRKPEANLEAAPHLAQHEVRKGVVQRSDTLRGSAHPVDPDEKAPYRSQEDARDEVQASSTEFGRAAPVLVGPQRQEDVPRGVVQRSDTPTGVATPIHSGGPLKAQLEKESALAKEARGEPVRAAAEPIEKAKPVKGASAKQSARRQDEAVEDVREVFEAAEPDGDAESALDVDSTPVPAAAQSDETERSAQRAAKRSTTAKDKE